MFNPIEKIKVAGQRKIDKAEDKADCIFENCNIEVKGEKFHLGEFDSEFPCKFINTRIDFKEVTRNDLLHFLYGGYTANLYSFFLF